MATIRKMRNKWQVLIRRKGTPFITKTLRTYIEATKYAQESETNIAKGMFQDLSEAMQTTLADALVRYRDEVCPLRKWGHLESGKINKLLRNKITGYSLARITPNKIVKFRNALALTSSASTVNKYMSIISVVYNTAKTEWDLSDDDAPKPKPPTEETMLNNARIREDMAGLKEGIGTLFLKKNR